MQGKGHIRRTYGRVLEDKTCGSIDWDSTRVGDWIRWMATVKLDCIELRLPGVVQFTSLRRVSDMLTCEIDSPCRNKECEWSIYSISERKPFRHDSCIIQCLNCVILLLCRCLPLNIRDVDHAYDMTTTEWRAAWYACGKNKFWVSTHA